MLLPHQRFVPLLCTHFLIFQVRACSASGFAVKQNRTCRRVTAGTGRHSVPAKRNHPEAIQTIAHVMPADPSIGIFFIKTSRGTGFGDQNST
jgi:hypothetical protein